MSPSIFSLNVETKMNEIENSMNEKTHAKFEHLQITIIVNYFDDYNAMPSAFAATKYFHSGILVAKTPISVAFKQT